MSCGGTYKSGTSTRAVFSVDEEVAKNCCSSLTMAVVARPGLVRAQQTSGGKQQREAESEADWQFRVDP